LPLDDILFPASAMFDEEVVAAWFEHATNLPEGGLCVRNRAKGPRRDDAMRANPNAVKVTLWVNGSQLA
jgi:hypothetical protein